MAGYARGANRACQGMGSPEISWDTTPMPRRNLSVRSQKRSGYRLSSNSPCGIRVTGQVRKHEWDSTHDKALVCYVTNARFARIQLRLIHCPVVASMRTTPCALPESLNAAAQPLSSEPAQSL